MSSEDEGFKQRLNPFGSAIGVKPSFKAAEYADLESNNAQLCAQLSALEADNAKLREECDYLANENVEFKLMIYNLRKQLSENKGSK